MILALPVPMWRANARAFARREGAVRAMVHAITTGVPGSQAAVALTGAGGATAS
jgi:hypothetical protein